MSPLSIFLRPVAVSVALAPLCFGQTPKPTPAVAPPAAEARVALSVGGRKIVLPAPEGFVRCDGLNAELDKAAFSMIPAGNRLLAAFGTPADRQAIEAGTTPDYSTNANVQVVRSVENEEIGEKSFGQIRKELKSGMENFSKNIQKELDKVTAAGNKRFTKEFGTDAAFSVSDTVFLGFFEDTETSLGFTMAAKTKSAAPSPSGEKEPRMVAAGLMTPVNGRMITFYFTTPYTGDQDKQRAEKAVAAWRDATVAANPRLAGPDMKHGQSQEERIGTLVGIFFGVLIFWLIRKTMNKKRAQPEA